MRSGPRPSGRSRRKRTREIAQFLKEGMTLPNIGEDIRRMTESMLQVDRGLGAFAELMEMARQSQEEFREVTKGLLEVARQMRASASSAIDLDRVMETARETARMMAAFEKSPKGRALRKMGNSKGVLHRLQSWQNVIFVPEAVLLYGFAHLPTKSDPEGKLYQELPAQPAWVDRMTGTYLFLPETGSRGRPPEPEDDPDVREALRIYEEHGKRGFPPTDVFTVLRADSGMEEAWVSIDLAGDVDKQLRAFKRRLTRIERELYAGEAGTRRKGREPGRDTLIYTLREAAGMSHRDIAKRAFGEGYSTRTAESLEGRVRQSLFKTRRALKSSKGPPTLLELP